MILLEKCVESWDMSHMHADKLQVRLSVSHNFLFENVHGRKFGMLALCGKGRVL